MRGPYALGGASDRRSPVVSVGGNKKAAAPVGTAAPGPRLWPRVSRLVARDLRPHPPCGGAASAYTSSRTLGCDSRSKDGRPGWSAPSTAATETQPTLTAGRFDRPPALSCVLWAAAGSPSIHPAEHDQLVVARFRTPESPVAAEQLSDGRSWSRYGERIERLSPGSKRTRLFEPKSLNQIRSRSSTKIAYGWGESPAARHSRHCFVAGSYIASWPRVPFAHPKPTGRVGPDAAGTLIGRGRLKDLDRARRSIDTGRDSCRRARRTRRRHRGRRRCRKDRDRAVRRTGPPCRSTVRDVRSPRRPDR